MTIETFKRAYGIWMEIQRIADHKKNLDFVIGDLTENQAQFIRVGGLAFSRDIATDAVPELAGFYVASLRTMSQMMQNQIDALTNELSTL